MDWKDTIEAFTLGAFPWISELKKMDIHFKKSNIEISKIDNFFASLFATSIFFYFTNINKYQLIHIWTWWVFILSAFILTIIYFIIFISNKEQVNNNKTNWPIIVCFVLYILIFCSLTTGFGILNVYKDSVVIKGQVHNSAGKCTRSDFSILFNSGKILNFKTNLNGDYVVLIDKDSIDKIQKIEVKNHENEYFSYYTFSEIAVFTSLEDIRLLKQ